MLKSLILKPVNCQNRLIISNICLGKDEKSDSDIDDGATEFEIRAKRMFNVLDDGGVKKKVTAFLANVRTQHEYKLVLWLQISFNV